MNSALIVGIILLAASTAWILVHIHMRIHGGWKKTVPTIPETPKLMSSDEVNRLLYGQSHFLGARIRPAIPGDKEWPIGGSVQDDWTRGTIPSSNGDQWPEVIE
jgi:hypothetical protein